MLKTQIPEFLQIFKIIISKHKKFIFNNKNSINDFFILFLFKFFTNKKIMLKKIIKKANSNIETVSLTGSYSIKGRKKNQEDDFYISEDKNGNRLILVADGVGGHGHGDFASKTITELFENKFSETNRFKDIPDFLHKNTRESASLVLEKVTKQPEYKNCGTTITGFFIKENKFYTLNVGDSRVYIYSKRKLTQLTKDHSLVQRMVERGEITEQEAVNHPKRNIMTSAIGQKISQIKIDVEGHYMLEHGDILFAFSDGVHDYLSKKELTELIEANYKNSNLAEVLVNSAYANGSKDNITACFYKY